MIKFLTDAVAKRYKGKICLLRIDLNTENGAPLDSYRLEAILPTIKLLLNNKVKVVILSHRGRPDGNEKKHSLAPFGPIFAKRLNVPLDFIHVARLGALKKAVERSNARVVLAENLRFFKGEESNDPTFARELAKIGDLYVNDAFAVSHRKNASVVAITKYLPSYGGLCLQKEIENLGGILAYTARPFVIILGGAKLKDKFLGLHGLIEKADKVLLGSNAFNETGISKGSKFIWPEDAKKHGRFFWDIGPFTVGRYADVIGRAKTIVWNGPVGFFENEGFERGTIGVWGAILKNKKANVVIGGGETIASFGILKAGKRGSPKNVFFSTGGGAMLDYLSGKKLPGLEALER
jgi:phosphoglycerate kinase